jgi:predicted nucleic acid-binding protein
MAAPITHVLDTSAWLIHLFKEPGSEQITELFRSAENQVGVSVLSLPELYGRLRSVGREREFRPLVEYYKRLFSALFPVTEPIALRAVKVRNAATSRLPSIDSIIAATAAVQGATLVHRDPHFLSIPGGLLEQEMLGS